ncbi:head maturation protease, ClpP-related [Bacillus sp. Au-Bac7]|uniref:head maturation protease, ClpP-related n=1 Tax=Bacillus sp. Au-Bac7 TaxID=2906458 RepID=UPI001E56CAF0|nr:head maturation protease, ClpP-related [Bacillus sp. Au-Bac7]MCE4048032.1 Clp protease ClpP [Bacillus sp. Au-Bac7]
MKLSIRGPIIPSDHQWIYDLFEMDAASPKKVRDFLDSIDPDNNEDIILEVNSGGGSVMAASEMYTLLREHPNNVISKNLGLAASAASYLLLAGDKVLMSPTAQIMIHNASTVASGDYRDMNHTSTVLKNVNISIANAYKLKTGKTHDELLAMMDNESWLTAQQAKQIGLIDEIMFDNGDLGIVASANPTFSDGVIPQAIIDKFRNEKLGIQTLDSQIPSPLTNQVINQTTINQNPGEDLVQPKEEPKNMDLETLKNDHPHLFDQVKNIGYQEGVTAENKRIKDIEDLQLPGNEELVNKAKFEDKMEASALAVEIIKAEKTRGTNYLNNVQKDAEIINQVPGGDAPANNNNNADFANALNAALNGTHEGEENELSNKLGGALG